MNNKMHLPFDNIKFFLKDEKTGELTPKYRCDDCYCIMDTPYFWYFAPWSENQTKRGYHFYCQECYELRDGKI